MKSFVARLYTECLPDQMVSHLESEIDLLYRTLPKKYLRPHKTQRGTGVTWHLGHWSKYSKTSYRTAITRLSVTQEFWFRTTYIWNFISNIIQDDLPEQYQVLLRLRRRQNHGMFFGLWNCLAINRLLRCSSHRDDDDLLGGVCVIIPVGSFYGGNLRILESNLAFKIARCSILALNSTEQLHDVDHFIGNRSSFVLFST